MVLCDALHTGAPKSPLNRRSAFLNPLIMSCEDTMQIKHGASDAWLVPCSPTPQGLAGCWGRLSCTRAQEQPPRAAPFGVLAGSPVVPVTAAAPLTCLPNHYRCNSGTCIVNSWVCDGYKDCADGSDEDACPTSRKLFSSSPSSSRMPGGTAAWHPSNLHRKFGHPSGSHPPAGWEDIAI